MGWILIVVIVVVVFFFISIYNRLVAGRNPGVSRPLFLRPRLGALRAGHTTRPS